MVTTPGYPGTPVNRGGSGCLPIRSLRSKCRPAEHHGTWTLVGSSRHHLGGIEVRELEAVGSGQFDRLLLARRIGDATVDHRYDVERSVVPWASARRVRAPCATAIVAPAPRAEHADAYTGEDKRDPSELHADMLKRNRALRNAHRYSARRSEPYS